MTPAVMEVLAIEASRPIERKHLGGRQSRECSRAGIGSLGAKLGDKAAIAISGNESLAR